MPEFARKRRHLSKVFLRRIKIYCTIKKPPPGKRWTYTKQPHFAHLVSLARLVLDYD